MSSLYGRNLASSGGRPAVVGFGQSRYPPGRGVEQDAMPGARGPDPNPDGQMGFPGARRTEQDHVLGFFKEDPGAQMRNEVPVSLSHTSVALTKGRLNAARSLQLPKLMGVATTVRTQGSRRREFCFYWRACCEAR